MSALLLLVASLAQAPEVTAAVDRTRLRVGEDVTLTVRARTRSPEPLEIVLPALVGFGVVASREFSQVSFSADAASSRTTVRELQLKVEKPGDRKSVV